MRRTMVAMLAATVLASAGEAATQVISFGGGGANVAMMPLFDSRLGTLQSANFTARYDSSAAFVYWGPAPADGAISGVFTLGGLGFALTGTSRSTLDSTPFGIFSVAGFGSAAFTDAADLAMLTGGSLVLAARVNASAPGTPIGGSPTAGIGYTVSYSYDDGAPAARQVGTADVGAVPEPASWAMMIGGFGLTGAALRRARRLSLRERAPA